MNLTKKTLVLKRADAEIPAADETPAAEPAPGDVLPVASVMAANAAEAAAAIPIRQGSYIVPAICAIVAVLMLLALLGVQWMEMSFYRDAIPVGSM